MIVQLGPKLTDQQIRNINYIMNWSRGRTGYYVLPSLHYFLINHKLRDVLEQFSYQHPSTDIMGYRRDIPPVGGVFHE